MTNKTRLPIKVGNSWTELKTKLVIYMKKSLIKLEIYMRERKTQLFKQQDYRGRNRREEESKLELWTKPKILCNQLLIKPRKLSMESDLINSK